MLCILGDHTHTCTNFMGMHETDGSDTHTAGAEQDAGPRMEGLLAFNWHVVCDVSEHPNSQAPRDSDDNHGQEPAHAVSRTPRVNFD